MNTNIFTKKQFVIIFALIAMFAWGCAYPFIKLGMVEWRIGANDAGGKMLFAGVRFATAGLLTFFVAKKKGQSLAMTGEAVNAKEKGKLVLLVLFFGLVNTALHYYCFYTGLSHCEGGKASIINSLSPFLLILLALFIFKEKLTINKWVGCIFGLAGIIVVNFGSDLSGFALNGEGMILLNCVCSAFGGILTRIVTKKLPAITATAYSLLTGGVMLILVGLLAGGRFTQVTVAGGFLLLGLIAISMVAFILYNQLICYNPISEIAIFNVLIPIFGTLMSCIMLGESFGLRNLFGLIFMSLGIFVLHYKRKGE